MTGPLSHIRVLDLSRILAGPWAGQLLADLGAEVIKVERPGAGDDTRHWGPPYAKDPEGNVSKESAYFLAVNRGKKSVEVDITSSDGQQTIRKLAATCDVLLENYKVGGLAQYGLDYDSLKPINPGLVYCSITGFGQDGPYANRAGYDFMIQAMGGLMSVTGEADGTPGGGPIKAGVALADVMTGLYAANAVQGALLHREQTGTGQHIDLALLDVQIATLANQAMNYLVTGDNPERMGNAHPNIVPYQAFATLDGHMVLAVGNDGQFARFCQAAGCAELAEDDRFTTNPGRVKHRDVLVGLLEAVMATRSTDEWVQSLEPVHVPCGPINTLDRVFDDPQVLHRGVRVDIAHPTLGSVAQVANPIRYSETPISYETPPPTLGQHTDEVLKSLEDSALPAESDGDDG